MKKILFFAVMLFAIGTTQVMTSCSNDDNNTPGVTLDTQAYDDELATCEALLKAATTNDYPQVAIDAFKMLVETAKEARPQCVSQAQLDAIVKSLAEGRKAFESTAYGAIPEENVVAKWTFDTDSKSQVSEGTYKWTAVCQKAPAIFGSNAEPKFVEGVSGKAVSVADGAHLTVSDFNSAAVLCKDFSISVWVKTSKTYANNYIVSYNFWNNWKLQVQDQNKPFFTFAFNTGIADSDNERDQSVKEGEWTHIVAALSLTQHKLAFYINGEETKVWDAEGKPALGGNTQAEAWKLPKTGGSLPIFIGLSTSEAAATEAWDWEWNAESLGAFFGAIDNLTFYNIALTEGQAKKLFKDKK